MDHVEELDFILSITDQVTGPVNKLMGKFSKLTQKASRGFGMVKNGAIGLATTGLLLTSALQPAIAMDRALGEVKSLGVLDGDLKTLQQTSLEFTTQFGGNATDFVKSSYDIQSAIAGLNGAELSKFTEQSNLLAKATKSDAATATDYIGTMYGIFENQANAMGKSKWVSVVAGQTAAAVQMFKTTGGEMAGAFSALGAEATSSGIGMAEQMAVLGQLQATMSGSEAGTKYKAFLAGVGKAQDALGLSFTDSEGKMLGVSTILDEINGKFGAIDTVEESDALSKAFGTSEAVAMIKLLSANTNGLKNNIAELGDQSDETKALLMAQAQVDPWQRAAGGVNALRISIGSTLLPIINPLINRFADLTATVQGWTQRFPNITRMIGLAAVAFLSLAAVMAVLTMVSGLATAAGAALGLVWATITTIMAILFSPIGLLVLGIGALIYYWDDLKESFGDTAAFKLIESIFTGWKLIFEELSKINPMEKFNEGLDWVMQKVNALEGFGLDLFGGEETQEVNQEQITKAVPGVEGVTPKLEAVSALKDIPVVAPVPGISAAPGTIQAPGLESAPGQKATTSLSEFLPGNVENIGAVAGPVTAFTETLMAKAAPAANDAQAFIQAPELSLMPGISQPSLPVPAPGALPPELSLVPGMNQGTLPTPTPGALPPELSLVPGINQGTLPTPTPGALPPELSLVPGMNQGTLPTPTPGALPPEIKLVPGLNQNPVTNQVMNLPKNDGNQAAQKKMNESAPTLRRPEKFKRTSNVFNSGNNSNGTNIENMTIQTQQAVNEDSLAHLVGMGA